VVAVNGSGNYNGTRRAGGRWPIDYTVAVTLGTELHVCQHSAWLTEADRGTAPDASAAAFRWARAVNLCFQTG
jgi:hypothetical protein